MSEPEEIEGLEEFETNWISTEIIKKDSENWSIIGDPRTGTGKDFNGKTISKLYVDIEKAGERYTYTPNATSTRFLIKKFGKKKGAWDKKKITFEIHEQVISGKKKDVVYVKGAL